MKTIAPQSTAISAFAVFMTLKCPSSIFLMEISDSAAASHRTVSQNPTNTITMETSPKARGPRMGACTPNNSSPKTWAKKVLVVSQEVGDKREPRPLTSQRLQSRMACGRWIRLVTRSPGWRPYRVRSRSGLLGAQGPHPGQDSPGSEFHLITPGRNTGRCRLQTESPHPFVDPMDPSQALHRAQLVGDADGNRHVIPVLHPMRRTQGYMYAVSRLQIV